MPVIGDLLSYADSKKRKFGRVLSDVVTDPMGYTQQRGAQIVEDGPEALANELGGALAPGGIAGIVKGGGVRFTPSERQFFKSLNSADREEMMMMIPSAKFGADGMPSIHPKDVGSLDDWVTDVTRLREGEKLPPSFYSGGFAKKFWTP